MSRAKANSPSTGPAALHGEVSDPIGDVRPFSSIAHPPDLVHGSADVADGNVTFTVRLAPGTFDPETTLLVINLDTDQNPRTGQSMAGDGVDYIVSMGDGQGKQALIGKYGGSLAKFDPVGHAPVTFQADGMTAAVPLSLLGNSNGKLNFRVQSFVHVQGSPTSGVLDVMPDLGRPPGRVR